MVITQNISVDLLRQNTNPVIQAKQYDVNSRFLNVTVLADGEAVRVSQTDIVRINVLRADNESNSFVGTVNANGTITVPIDGWILLVPGKSKLSVSISSATNSEIKSLSFQIYVEPAEYKKDVYIVYYARSEEIPAGSYYVEIDNRAYSFTLGESVPVGGVIAFNFAFTIASTYTSSALANEIETNLPVVNSETGTELEEVNPILQRVIDSVRNKAEAGNVYTKHEVDILLSEKAFRLAVEAALADKVDKTALETKLTDKISLEFNSSTYVLTLKYTDDSNTVHTLGTVDLPLENILLGASVSGNILTMTFRLGTDETKTVSIDLSSMLSEAVANKANTADVGSLSSLTTTVKTSIVAAINEINSGLANKANSADVYAKSDTYSKTEVDTTLDGKQDTLTFDNAPTENSTNPVKSGGVYSALAGKADLVDGKVPAAQLPSFVDDVVEYAGTENFPLTGESGKIYVDSTTNKSYRWSGADYVEISSSLALGETASTAYAGNKGKENADAISALQTAMQGKSNVDGYYKKMIVGYSEQLLSTVGVQSTEAFTTRTTGGSADVASGPVRIKKIKGNTILSGGSLISCKPSGMQTVGFNLCPPSVSEIVEKTISGQAGVSLSSNEVSTIKAWLKDLQQYNKPLKWEITAEPYETTTAALSLGGLLLRSPDGEGGLKNTLIISPRGETSLSNVDIDGVTTILLYGATSGMTLTSTTLSNACMHFKKDGTRNGDYEEYWTRTFNVDTATYFPNGMRSAPEVYDEINFETHKAITRCGIRAYESGDESDPTVVTDMTNTVYPLTTPTEVSIPESTPNIYQAYNYGTETWLQTGNPNPAAPVGSELFYYANLRDKLQHLPFLASEDGSYIVKQTGTQMKLVAGYTKAQIDSLIGDIDSVLDSINGEVV